MKKNVRIIFMGTPDFAVPALGVLKQEGYDIVLVVTRPDRPKGRGRKIVSPPVKKAAKGLGCDVMQPLSVKDRDFEKKIRGLQPDVIIVIAFGHILPENILLLPKIASINIHASLLPKYRGPAPIQWAIINRENVTGVTAMLMDSGLDTGDILLSSKIRIASNETAATLHDRLADLGAELLIETLSRIEKGDINPLPQDHAKASYAPLLKKEDGHINWEMPAESIEAFIRGMIPWPGAFTFHGNERLKIFSARPVITETGKPPGTIIKGFSGELRVATGDGYLSIIEIQGKSGKRLLIKDFLLGYKISPDALLS